MALGKRIEARLKTLGWKRKDLIEEVCRLGLAEGKMLSPAALGQLISRDSRRSEWDLLIAQALGMSVIELVYGTDTPYSLKEYVVPLLAAEYGNDAEARRDKTKNNIIALPTPAPGNNNALKDELTAIADSMNERGIAELIGYAKALAKNHPKAKANPAS